MLTKRHFKELFRSIVPSHKSGKINTWGIMKHNLNFQLTPGIAIKQHENKQ
jgi:hypothetical protein